MKDILLLIAVISFFIIGYHIMNRIDFFIAENREKRYKETQIKNPSSVKIPGDMPLIEIDKEIDKFRQTHPNFEIILRDESD